MRNPVDLHVHTHCSDGLLSPREVVDFAARNAVKVLAICDHDTVDAHFQLQTGESDGPLTLIPAVELSTAWKGTDFHILGYFVDYKDAEFGGRIQEFRRERLIRGEAIVKKLNELGIDLSIETVKRVAGDSAVGRPHIADALVKEEYVLTFDEAFARYLGYHAPAYVAKKYLTPQEAIALIHRVKGVAIWAHPGTVGRDNLLRQLVDMGLDGIEAFHPLHDPGANRKYIELATKHGLIYTGGSDCHGRKEQILIGTQKVPDKCLDMLENTRLKYV